MRWFVRSVVVGLLLSIPFVSQAAEVAGVELSERITARDGSALRLHGAGLREKFFFDIYVAALYLPERGQTAQQIRSTEQPGRVEMHLVYDEISQEKLAKAWRDGFADNNPEEVLATVEDRLTRFIEMFPAAVSGDTFVMEYVPDDGTAIRVNGDTVGKIDGGEFFRALLGVWLGPDPPGDAIKRGMLGAE